MYVCLFLSVLTLFFYLSRVQYCTKKRNRFTFCVFFFLPLLLTVAVVVCCVLYIVIFLTGPIVIENWFHISIIWLKNL